MGSTHRLPAPRPRGGAAWAPPRGSARPPRSGRTRTLDLTLGALLLIAPALGPAADPPAPPLQDAAAPDRPRLDDLLSRQDHSGDPAIPRALLWYRGGYRGLKVVAEFDPADLGPATDAGVRRVEVTFKALDGASRRPFRPLADDPEAFACDGPAATAADRALRMRVYFVGRRVRDLHLLPYSITGPWRTVRVGDTGYSRLALRDLRLQFQVRSGDPPTTSLLTDYEQRLIADPEGRDPWSFLICVPTCTPPAAADADPCEGLRGAQAAAWETLGAPACMGSLDYLACGIEQTGVEIAALDRRYAPLAGRLAAFGEPPPPCNEPPPDPQQLGLPGLNAELAAARTSLAHARDCLDQVDGWLAGGFRCAEPGCGAPAERTALAFLNGGSTRAHDRLIEAGRHLERLEAIPGVLPRLQQSYRVRCRGVGEAESGR